MKLVIYVVLISFMQSSLVMASAVPAGGPAGGPVPVSITRFANKVGNQSCRYQWDFWGDRLGTGFQEMLANELMATGKIELLERETINDIYAQEHDLVNSEEDPSLRKGKFKKAKYTFAGAVTEFEYCAEAKKTSVNVGALASLLGGGMSIPFEIGFGKATAKLAIDVRMIDVETGRVIKTVRAEGRAEDSHFDLEAGVVDFTKENTTPMGQAVRQAIQNASSQLISAL